MYIVHVLLLMILCVFISDAPTDNWIGNQYWSLSAITHVFLVSVSVISERCNRYCNKCTNNVIYCDNNIINCLFDY